MSPAKHAYQAMDALISPSIPPFQGDFFSFQADDFSLDFLIDDIEDCGIGNLFTDFPEDTVSCVDAGPVPMNTLAPHAAPQVDTVRVVDRAHVVDAVRVVDTSSPPPMKEKVAVYEEAARPGTNGFTVATAAERKLKIQRYLEKRKRRSFKKRIVCKARKEVAQGRTRVGGRFTKSASPGFVSITEIQR